jgi:hypothetical protein
MDEQDSPQEKKQRISNATAFWMIAVALLCDLLLPIGAIAGTVIFWIWFLLKGVPPLSPKNFGKSILNLIVNGGGEVGTAGIWVGITLGVVVIIWISRIEDRAGIQVLDKITPEGKFASQTAQQTTSRTLNKTARRVANPERTEIAVERLERMKLNRSVRPSVDSLVSRESSAGPQSFSKGNVKPSAGSPVHEPSQLIKDWAKSAHDLTISLHKADLEKNYPGGVAAWEAKHGSIEGKKAPPPTNDKNNPAQNVA